MPVKNTMENKLQALENELVIDFVRSSGKGGQSVNKLSTKAQLHWNVKNSNYFSLEEKKKIKFFLKNRLTKEDDIILESQKERSQIQNKEIVLTRLKNLIKIALTPAKKRVPTKPTKGSREKRLEEKKIQSQKKTERIWKPTNNY